MFEGTGIYFFLLFLILFIVYLTVKICLGKLFKEMKIPAWKAYIPFYCTLILTDILDIKKSVFYKSLIPIVNLYYYKIIIAELLKAYQLNPKEAIWFVIFPMYKFPELVFKNPKFMLHIYDETEEFLVNQNALFETSDKDSKSNNTGITIEPNVYNQTLSKPEVSEITEKNNQTENFQNNIYNEQTYQTVAPNQINNQDNIQSQNNNESNTVYFNKNLEPDERHETIIEAKTQEKKEEKPIIIDKSKPKVCPKCGTKLSPTATTCFLCGTKLL